MNLKKLTKILWFGDDLTPDGKAKAPDVAPDAERHLEGINLGEIYICANSSDPAIFIKCTDGAVMRISGAGEGGGTANFAKIMKHILVPIDAAGNAVMLEDGETPDYFNTTGAVVSMMVAGGLNFVSQGEVTAFFAGGTSGGEGGDAFGGTLATLKDVNLVDLKDNQVLVWDAASGKWINKTGGTGGASSWDELTGKPTWIGSSKPSYQLSEIGGAPSASKMQAWDEAADKRHSHNNLTNVLEKLTVNHLNMLINLCKYVSFDSVGNITFEKNVIGKMEITAFGDGTTAGGSGSTGGGESGGEGSGGGYEDGGGTGGGTTAYTYRIVFNANGGSTSAPTINFSTEDAQSDITREHIATKSGDTFIGWAATSSYSRQRIAYASSFGGVADNNGVTAKNTEGIWTINDYARQTGGSLTTSGNVKTLTLYAQWLSMSGNESSGSGDWVLKTVLQYNASYYSYEGDGIVYHFDPDYFNGVDAMRNKTAKKVKFYTSSAATTNVKIYLVDDTTKNVLQTISVSGVRGEEISLPDSGILIESGTHLAFSGNGLLRGTTSNASAEYYGGIEISEVLGEQKSYNYVPMIDFYLE